MRRLKTRSNFSYQPIAFTVRRCEGWLCSFIHGLFTVFQLLLRYCQVLPFTYIKQLILTAHLIPKSCLQPLILTKLRVKVWAPLALYGSVHISGTVTGSPDSRFLMRKCVNRLGRPRLACLGSAVCVTRPFLAAYGFIYGSQAGEPPGLPVKVYQIQIVRKG